jgi:hypothetical protein
MTLLTAVGMTALPLLVIVAFLHLARSRRIAPE